LLEKEIEVIEKHLFQASNFKSWIENQVRELGVNGSTPDVNEFLNKLGTKDFDNAVKFGALDAPLCDYLLLFLYLSGFSTRETEREYLKKAWNDVLDSFWERISFYKLMDDIKSGVCDDCSTISEEELYHTSGSMRRVVEEARIDVIDARSERSILTSDRTEAVDDSLQTVLAEAEEATLTKHQLKLLDLLRMDAAMTYADMARHTGRSRAAVSKDIARLKELGLLKRVGSDKTGRWVASLPSSKS
jgi:predicted transcriptional regulator